MREVFDVTGVVLIAYVVLQLFFPAPLGVILKGVVFGGLTAMVSFGIALVYRTSRIVNFAQGDLGTVPAVLALLLMIGAGWPYPLAVITGLLAAVVLGVVVEGVFIRRFFKAPRLILTVATIFISALLAGVALILPDLFDVGIAPHSFPAPFSFSFEVSPIVFQAFDLIAVLTVPVVIGALAAFFRFTSLGVAVRATAENAERAFLLGIPVRRIHMIVWVLATLLATVAMMLQAGIIGLPIGRVLGPGVLLGALAAAVIGRFERLPIIFVASVVIGVVQNAVVFATARSILVDPILFIIVLAGLLFQRRGEVSRAQDLGSSSWQAAEMVRPVPDELLRLPEVRWATVILGIGGFGLLLCFPLFLSDAPLNLAGVVVIFAIIGLSLVVLTGWAGQVSLGQMAFVGIGAAVAGALTSRVGWDISIAIGLSGLAGALAAVLVGLPALRIRGLFLAVTTFAFALATSSYLLNRTFFDWWLPVGRVYRTPFLGRIVIESETRYYYFTLFGLFLALGATRSLRRSRAGRVLIAVRENERAAQAFSVNATRAKLTAFALSGFLAAFAGGLLVHHQERLGINTFFAEESLAAFVMVTVGGLGSVPGAILGAIWHRGFLFFLPSGWRFLSSGLGGLLILMLIPGGLGSMIYGVRDVYLRWVAKRRGIIVPSLLADIREQDPPPAVTVVAPPDGARKRKPARSAKSGARG